MNRQTILLTNDDGIASPGLAAAAEALMTLGRLVVAAPLTQQTSMGRAYTGCPDACFQRYPLAVNGKEIEAYSCDASPAAVVRHALLALPHFSPALVVAGINYGENIGSNVTGSGTVGATMEAAANRIPALAVSLETDVASHREYTPQDWSGSLYFTRFFAENILRKGMPPGVDVLKVEVPSGATEETSWRMTRLSPFPYYEASIPGAGPHSRRGETVFAKRSGVGEPSDTDAYAIRTARAVAVTPLSLDLTASTPLNTVSAWVEK